MWPFKSRKPKAPKHQHDWSYRNAQTFIARYGAEVITRASRLCLTCGAGESVTFNGRWSLEDLNYKPQSAPQI